MTSSTPSTAASAPLTAAPSKICFNSLCKEPRSEVLRRKGWKLRSGEHAELCDRCCSAYEQGTFCETFHSDAAGWRKCELCAKRVHCGCIISLSSYMLLDAGGVECIACARKTLAMAPNNHVWSPSLLLSSPQVSERPKEPQQQPPVRSWSQMTTSFPGHWRQGTHLWGTGVQSDLQQRLAYEFDRPIHGDKLIQVRGSVCGQEKKVGEMPERLVPGSHIVRGGAAGTVEPPSTFNLYHREQGNVNGVHDSGHHLGVVSETYSTGSSLKPHPSNVLKGDASSLLVGMANSFPSGNGSNDTERVSVMQSQQRQMAPPLPKQFTPNPHNVNDSFGEMRNSRPRVDPRARVQLLPRYWPRITDQELQQISGDSNSVITPLFEKMLSASDAGRIGRLVLPKKCAEAYFPPISHPEGLPLKVQDAGGKVWVFQFRFWPNNNSRMYVLEGVTPCIQSMQLQAGDTVTFSRLDPEGKLVMGFRKANNVSSEQDPQNAKTGNGFPTTTEGNKNVADVNVNGPPPQKGNTDSRNPSNTAVQTTLSNFDKTGFIQKEGLGTKSSQGPTKRKGSTLGSKNKRLRIENEDSLELNLTWEEAQGLLRPPPDSMATLIVIDGIEIEEYEEAPVLGKATIFTTNQAGGNSQWAQCEDCSKWRKVPADALLPCRWVCSENKWDPDRSSCSSAQETSMELTDLLPTRTDSLKAGSKRTSVKAENNNLEVSDGLDTLANLAILGEGDLLPSSSQPTTRHPRHRSGCTCIVCIQPPSGKGPKHKPTCTCNVCLTVKRRFRTLMMRREKRQTEKGAETAAATSSHKKQPILDESSEVEMASPGSERSLLPACQSISGSSSPQSPVVCIDGAVEDDSEKITVPSPLKTQIDLNIQPEREEEPSPVAANGGSMMRVFRDEAPI